MMNEFTMILVGAGMIVIGLLFILMLFAEIAKRSQIKSARRTNDADIGYDRPESELSYREKSALGLSGSSSHPKAVVNPKETNGLRKRR